MKLGYRLVFQSFTKTLSDNEIREHVLKNLNQFSLKEGGNISFESLKNLIPPLNVTSFSELKTKVCT